MDMYCSTSFYDVQIENKVLDALSRIIEYGGIVDSTTLNSIVIQDMEMSEDGRDINIRYTIPQNNSDPTRHSSAGFKDDADIDSTFFDFSNFYHFHIS